MVKGIMVFGHVDQGQQHNYFKTILKFKLEKVCADFDIDILESKDDVTEPFPPNPGHLPSVPVLTLTFQGKHPYMHALLKGVADYFRETVDGCICSYKTC